MINFISSWAEQIVLAVVVATIIELILPKNKNKKYIQMVIGIYVLFNIISPIIKNKDNFSVEKYNTEKYESQSQYEIDQSSMDARIEKIYLEELEKKTQEKFQDNGYVVTKCKVDAVLDTTKKNAGISLITIKIEKTDETEKLEKVKSELATEFEISEDKIKIVMK
mgnify:FL=1